MVCLMTPCRQHRHPTLAALESPIRSLYIFIVNHDTRKPNYELVALSKYLVHVTLLGYVAQLTLEVVEIERQFTGRVSRLSSVQ